jgi:hypothetical protein
MQMSVQNRPKKERPSYPRLVALGFPEDSPTEILDRALAMADAETERAVVPMRQRVVEVVERVMRLDRDLKKIAL